MTVNNLQIAALHHADAKTNVHSKGRATTADPIMKFLCELGDNGVVWNVLSYWSARLY